ncbi:MAG: DnaJ domain-containing protein [Opitutales bacterium]|nr:DnaJ domain-containing protein [Opitutales bacterium]MDG1324756.1 DnaJ domain-containing protein [Opitutales bacterium]
MNWWGKLIGTGVGMLGGPVGLIAGAALGHLYDEDDPTPQDERKARILYLAYFFSCAAKVAKADGGISANEIEVTESLIQRMGLDYKTAEFAKNVFRKAKTSRRSVDEDLKEAGRLIGYDPIVGQSFLGGLFEIIRSNGNNFNELQVRFLLYGEERLKLKPGTVRSWIRGGYAPPHHDSSVDSLSIEDAYHVLNIKQECNERDLKKAYRAKAGDFHPDKLKSKNLPQEFLKFANDQLTKINQAYEVISKARGIN